MKIYAIVGTGQQTIIDDIVVYIPQDSEILMREERPSAEHIAAQNGIWIIAKQSLDELKTQKLQQITTWTSLAIAGGFISTSTGSEVRYDSDVDTQITMLALNATVGVEALIKRYPNGYPFRGYKKLLDGFESEKTPQYLNPEQVLQFCADLSEHIERQKQHGWELQELVKLATTSLELDSVVW